MITYNYNIEIIARRAKRPTGSPQLVSLRGNWVNVVRYEPNIG